MSVKRFVRQQFSNLALFPDYFRSIAGQWQNVLFGESVLAVAFLIWWALANPPTWALIATFVGAMFIGGYYAWRAEHVQLIPKLDIGEACVQGGSEVASGIEITSVQIVMRAAADVPVVNCRAALTDLRQWNQQRSVWEPTVFEESLDFLWSMTNEPSTTIQPGVPQRLNICRLVSTNEMAFLVHRIPQTYRDAIDCLDKRYLCTICVNARDCPPVRMELEIGPGREWWNPTLGLRTLSSVE